MSRHLRLFPLIALLLLVAAQCGPPAPTPPGGPAGRVAVLTPQSGELATFGEFARNGILLAFDEWNDAGGPNGLRIEWVQYDSKCEPEAARQAVADALADGLRLLVGPLCAEAAIPAAEAAQAAGALLITPTASHPLVTVDPGGRTRSLVFRAVYADPYQGELMAEFAHETLDAGRAAVLVDPTDPYSRSVGQAFEAAFAAAGGQTLRLAYEPAAEDFGPLLAEAAGFGAQVLFAPDRYAVVNRVAEQKAAAGLAGAPLLGPDSWQAGDLDLRALEGSYFLLPFSGQADSPALAGWTERYKFAYAVEPDALAALGYEAGWLLAAAIDAAGDVRPAAVARALERGSFEVLGQPLSFDAGHNPRRAVPLLRVEGEAVEFEAFLAKP